MTIRTAAAAYAPAAVLFFERQVIYLDEIQCNTDKCPYYQDYETGTTDHREAIVGNYKVVMAPDFDLYDRLRGYTVFVDKTSHMAIFCKDYKTALFTFNQIKEIITVIFNDLA